MFIGKVIGAFFGFLLTKSFVGMCLGLFFGHMFDKGLKNNLQPLGIGADARAKIQTLFFKTSFSVMGHIAKADGRVNESEIQMARLLMQDLGLNEQQKQQAMEYYRDGKRVDFDLNQSLLALKNLCAPYPHLLQLFLEIQLQSVYADGSCHPNERKLLEVICEAVGISHFTLAQCEARLKAERAFRERYEHRQWEGQQSRGSSSRHQTVKDVLAEAYGVLGVPQSASFAEVKKAYRKLMSVHHPDKLVSQGLPEEMIKLATEKTQKIQQAYDVIEKQNREHA